MNKNRMSIIKLLSIFIILIQLTNVSAQTDYYSFTNFALNYDYINRLQTNGIAFPKSYRNALSLYSSYNPVAVTSGPINTEQIYMQCLFDFDKIKEYYNAVPSDRIITFSVWSSGRFYFAGTTRAFMVGSYIQIQKSNSKIVLIVSFYYENLGSFDHTINIDFNSSDWTNTKYIELIVSVGIQYDSNNNRNYGYLSAKAVKFNNQKQAIGYAYTGTNGLYSAGNCYVSLDFAYIQTQIDQGSLEFSNNMFICYRSLQTSTDKEVQADFSYLLNEDWSLPSETFDNTLESKPYWTYNSFELSEMSSVSFYFVRNYSSFDEQKNETINNTYEYNYTFNLLSVNSKQNKFYYSTNTINPESWGNWKIVIYKGWFLSTEFTIDFNWLRNFFVWTVNSIIFLIQCVLFLLTIAFNYLLLFPVLWLAVVIWNYPIRYVVYGIIGIVFWISFFFVWLWNQIVILWKLIIEPLIEYLWNWIVKTATELMEYMKNEGFLWLYGFIIVVFSYIASAILYVLAFGSVDYNTIFQFVSTLNWNVFLFFYEIFRIFVDNILVFLQFVVLYFTALGFLLMKLIYAKAKGYTSRVEKLQSAINFYKYPIDLIYRLIQMFIGMKSTENN